MSENTYEKMNIQWFPGHMAKARRMIEDNLKNVDAVCEILDARIPESSRNPDIDKIAAGMPRILILNRADLADPAVTEQWKEHFQRQGMTVIATDAKSGSGVREFIPAVKKTLAAKIKDFEAKGQSGRTLRVMVLGIPNVGKSTFINRVAGRKAAAAGDKPGVTRGRQWISLEGGLELLDTPGILWPKFERPEAGELLAITNAIKSDITDRETLAANFMLRLRDYYPGTIEARYKFVPSPGDSGYEMLEKAASKRGFLISRGEFDIERMANTLLNEYHEGKLGRISLEVPGDGSVGD